MEVIRVGEYQGAAPKIEHVELDQVDTGLDRCPERAQGVLGSEGGGAAVSDPQHAAGWTMKLDHELFRDTARTLPSHQRATSAKAIACPTTIAAASCAVFRQNTSG